MFAKNYHLHWTQAEQVFSVTIWYEYFSNFGRGFWGSFSMLFPKASASCGKKKKFFCCIVLLFVWAQKVCLRLLKFYFRLEILIFLSFVVSFLVDMFNQKGHFLAASAVRPETHFSREAIDNQSGRVLK